ncbi:uncharacterized protein LOC134825314 [Bolinopsis microptera]
MLYLMYAETPNIHLPDTRIDQYFEERLWKVMTSDLCLRNPTFSSYVLYYADRREYWAMPYRNLEALAGVRTNNGIESLNNVLKHRVFNGVSAHRSLPQLLASLVFDFIPNRLQTYRHKMISDSVSYKRIVSQNHVLPSFFNGIPSKNLILVKESYFRSFEKTKDDIRKLGDQYVVRTKDSEGNPFAYKVSLSEEVRCDCIKFRGTPTLPCKHVLAILRIYEIDWTQLPTTFRLSPHLSVDSTLGRNVSTELPQQVYFGPDRDHQLPDEDEGSCTNEPIEVIDQSCSSEEVPGPSTADKDLDFNKSFSILSDLKTQMFRIPASKRGELLKLMEDTVRDQLIPSVRKLGENAQIRRDDFAATLPKPTKKKRKLFPKYTGQHSDSDFE